MALENEKQCYNCKKNVSAGNFDIHVVHCQRHIILCSQCSEPVPRSQLQEHLDTAHNKVKCQLCEKQFESCQLEEHKKICTKRLIGCSYCEMEVLYETLEEHESYCGSRTEKCEDCGQFVMIKDQARHLKNGHEALEKDRNTSNNFLPLRNNFSSSAFQPAKKANVETHAYHRQSPLKRTNDMPQLNTSFIDPEKESEKTSINDVEADSGTRSLTKSEEYDKLLAMQLAEEDLVEDQMESSHQYPESVPPLAPFTNPLDLLRPFGMPPQISTDHYPFNSDLIWSHHPTDELLDEEFLREFSDPPIPNVYPPVSATVPLRSNIDLPAFTKYQTAGDDALPCEFCNELFPSDMLIQHESGCCPDIAHGFKPESTANVYTPDTAPKPVLIKPVPKPNVNQSWLGSHEEVMEMLPCSYCKMEYPDQFLLQHEDVCEKNPTVATAAFLKALQVPVPSSTQRISPLRTATQQPILSPAVDVRRKSYPAQTQSRPPADFRFDDLVGDTERKRKSQQTEHSPPNPASQPDWRRSPFLVQNRQTVSVDPSARGEAMRKYRATNEQINPKPVITKSYLQEMRQALQPAPASRNLVVTGTRPKMSSKLTDNQVKSTNEKSDAERQQKMPITSSDQQSTEKNTSNRTKTNDSQLENAYRRFLSLQNAQYRSNNQTNRSVVPQVGRTGAIPKQKSTPNQIRKPFPEE